MNKDDKTWLNIAITVAGLIAGYVGYRFADTVGVQSGWVDRYEWFGIAKNIFALMVGAASAYSLMLDPERRDFFLASIAEVRKVKWPSLPDTKKMTTVVVVVVAIFGVILGAFDFIWSNLLKTFLAS